MANLDFGLWGSVFAVPKKLVDKHLRFCSHTQLKVLLMALRDGSRSIDVDDIAKRLSVDKQTVIESLEYWETTDVLTNTPNAPKTIPVEGASTEAVENRKKARIALTKREAADIVEQNPEFRSMLEELELIMGKPLSFATHQEPILYMCYTENLSPAVVLLVAQYCREKGRLSVGMLKKELENWLCEGVFTYEQAERHIDVLKQRNLHEMYVRTDFSIAEDYVFKKYERQMIVQWYEELCFSRELIQLAVQRSRNFTGEASFAYINKILKNWSELGISTVEQANSEKNIRRTDSLDSEDEIFGMNRLMI